MRRPAGWLLAALVAPALALSACGGGGAKDRDSEGSSSSSAPSVAPTGNAGNSGGELGGDTGYTVAGALTELPYAAATSKAPVTVLTGDLQRATALAGQRRPTSRNAKALTPWLRALTGDVTVPLAPSTGLTSVNIDPTGKALGFTAADVRFYAELQSGDDRFSVETLYAGTRVRQDLPVSDGLRTTSSGKPGSATKDPLLLQQFPKVNVLAQTGQRIAFASRPADVRAWKTGKGKRLATSKALATVARALDARKVYAAQLVAGDFGVGPATSPVAIARKFDAVGVGFTLLRGNPIVTVAYHFPLGAAEGARQVASAWREGADKRSRLPLSDLIKLTGTRVTGDVVTATLDASASGPSFALDLLSERQAPFMQADR